MLYATCYTIVDSSYRCDGGVVELVESGGGGGCHLLDHHYVGFRVKG
jgi:hypothetical protein